jgi:uncharacterized membrane protein
MAGMRAQSRWAHTLICLAIVLAGFGVRSAGLGADSLWYDETVSAFLAGQDVAALVAHTARDIHPPGYYLVLHAWVRVAGDSEFTLAFLSLVWGILLCALTYRLARRLLGKRVAGWALMLVALSPYNVWYSQEVRMYTLAAVLGVLVVWSGSAMVTKHHLLAVAGYVLCAATGLYVLYYFAFLLLALNGLFLAHLTHRRAWRTLATWIAAQAAVVVLYAPWVPIAWRQATEPPVPPWRSAVPLLDALIETWTTLTFGQPRLSMWVWPLLVLVGLLFVWGLRGAWRVRSRRSSAPAGASNATSVAAASVNPAALLLTALFGPLALIAVASVVTPLYHVRYVFTYAPAFYIILAGGLAWLMQRTRLVAVVALAAVLAGGTYGLYEQRAMPEDVTDDLRGAVRFLAARWRPGDAVLVNAGYAYTAFAYYYPEPIAARMRLTDYRSPANLDAPLVLQTGIIGGDTSLGWGDAQSDFYATTGADTTGALARVLSDYPRLWVLRIYDTVADPDGVVRAWLAEATTPFEDRAFAGSAYPHVQGYMARRQPAPPPGPSFALAGGVDLVGSQVPSEARAGESLDVVLWWRATGTQPAVSPPYAVSLKLWDVQSEQTTPPLVAQADEWPLGGLLLTPTWPRDVALRHPMRLRLPLDLTAGRYRLEVQLYDSATLQPFDRLDGAGNSIALGDIRVVGGATHGN